ncbi:MAG: hypothetical protein HWN67_11545 [Candidatus Helarchaeota archaeon]|nr:hypothetical protein [Candidatus Helarchaeota archaeon]
MSIKEIENILQKFRWGKLERLYGSAHPSIIGFIATEWLSQSKKHCVLDGAPSPIVGGGRRGQKNADIILCKQDNPFIVVEVETSVKKYFEKIRTIFKYLENITDFNGIEFGLLFMCNRKNGREEYKHCWDSIKSNVRNNNHSIALVSIEKEKSKLNGSIISKLRKRSESDYYQWEIIIKE